MAQINFSKLISHGMKLIIVTFYYNNSLVVSLDNMVMVLFVSSRHIFLFVHI